MSDETKLRHALFAHIEQKSDEVWKSIDDLQKAMEAVPHADRSDRILNFANVVGRENVIAGADCGFGTFAGRVQVDIKIVWLKLQSLAEGARRASAQLWAKPES